MGLLLAKPCREEIDDGVWLREYGKKQNRLITFGVLEYWSLLRLDESVLNKLLIIRN